MWMDYFTLGNHDFNFGYEALKEYLDAMDGVCLCANVKDLGGELARGLVQRAGDVLRRVHLDFGAVRQKTGHQDPVTKWDAETERFLGKGILSAFPQDSIVGVWRGGTAIRVSNRSEISELLLSVPDVLHAFLNPHPYQAGLIRLAQDVRGVRRLGSVALELCAVAAGEADVFIAPRSSPWDHNAARIILTQATAPFATSTARLCLLVKKAPYWPQIQNDWRKS